MTLQIFIHRIQHTYTPSLTVHLKSKALFTSLKIIVLTSNAELADFFFNTSNDQVHHFPFKQHVFKLLAF